MIRRIFLASSILAAPLPAQSGLKLPQVFEDYCEGESCRFGCRLAVAQPIELRQRDNRSAPVVVRLVPGDTVFPETGNLPVTRAGIVRVIRDTILATDDGEPRTDTLRLVRGDTLLVTAYIELGAWRWWYRGKEGQGIEFWNGEGQRFFGRGRDSLPAIMNVQPEREFWMRLTADRGRSGWWRAEPDHLDERADDQGFYCARQ